MKKIMTTAICLLTIISLGQAQCKRFEIGLGVGPMQMYHSGESNISVKNPNTNFSRVNSILSDDTRKKSGITSPAIYFGYGINKKIKLRASFNYYQETRTQRAPLQTFAPLTNWNENYSGNFSQYRLATGVAYTLPSCCCMRTYVALDLVNYLEKANESYTKSYSEGGKVANQFIQNKDLTYSVGLSPSFGIKKNLCHDFSVSYEAGAEVKYNAGQFNNVHIICTPLSRLSLNYKF